MNKMYELGVQVASIFRNRLRYKKDFPGIRTVKIHNPIVALGRCEMGQRVG